jgi:hypothetical protein
MGYTPPRGKKSPGGPALRRDVQEVDVFRTQGNLPMSDQFPEVCVTDQRRSDRRKRQIPVAIERRSGKDRRAQGERRRQIDPTTCERDYTDDEIQFMKAMDQYKRDNRRPFPTWSEVLEVLRALGYRKVAEATVLPGLPSSTAASANN